MLAGESGKLVRLHLSEQDRYEDKPLYEAVVKKCQELDVASATVFRGLEGYGESSEIYRSHLLTHDQPILLTIVETADKVDRILPELERMLGSAVIAVSDVQVIRVQNGSKAVLNSLPMS